MGWDKGDQMHDFCVHRPIPLCTRGPVALWIRRLTSDQKTASSSLVGVGLFLHSCLSCNETVLLEIKHTGSRLQRAPVYNKQWSCIFLPPATNVFKGVCQLLPPATKLGQGYIFTGVCDSVHSGGLPQCMLGYCPPPRGPDKHPPSGPSRHPPGLGTPLTRQAPPPRRGRYPPPEQSVLGDTVNERAVLECNLVQFTGGVSLFSCPFQRVGMCRGLGICRGMGWVCVGMGWVLTLPLLTPSGSQHTYGQRYHFYI